MKSLQKTHATGYDFWLRLICIGTILAVASFPARGDTNSYAGVDSAELVDNYWKPIKVDPSAYGNPYSIGLFNPQNGESSGRLWSQTKSIGIYGLGVFGALVIMPENLTGWDMSDPRIHQRWVNNVTTPPEWDRNDWIYNYVGHAYCGGIYYQIARKSGYRQWDSFVYSFLMSTFYWEYGVEAFAETPSIQDLVYTPVAGWIFGEWAFQSERQIRARGNTLAGSKLLGNTALCILDPIDALGKSVNTLTGRNLVKAGTGYFSYTAAPAGDETDHQVMLNVNIPLDADPEEQEQYDNPQLADLADPVDTGIIGLSFGTGRAYFDDHWNIDDVDYKQVTMGLYFTPRVSARLAYAWGTTSSEVVDYDITYENYSIEAQYYLNPEHWLRPYVTAGIGEQGWERDEKLTTFQWTAGAGIHCRLHRKWALNASFVDHYGVDDRTHDQQMGAGIIYRFGDGEHYDW